MRTRKKSTRRRANAREVSPSVEGLASDMQRMLAHKDQQLALEFARKGVAIDVPATQVIPVLNGKQLVGMQAVEFGEYKLKRSQLLDLSPNANQRLWDVPGLPQTLRNFVMALEKHGGEADTTTLRNEIGREPSRLRADFPTWRSWYLQWIEQPRRGVYRLNKVPSESRQNPVKTP